MPTLQWLDKDKHIQAHKNAPYRALNFDSTLSHGDNATDNMVIQGDNLDVLKSLLPYYASQVKCIYIDPPYNTGNAFEHYDDNLKHSQWLGMMYPRLVLLRELLAEDGAIIVHIDYRHEANIKLMLDEIFGARNYLNTISVKDSHASGLKLSAKEKTIIKTMSSMIVFKKSNIKINPIYQERKDWDTHFNTFMDISKRPFEKDSLKSKLLDLGFITNNDKLDYSLLNQPDCKKFIMENVDNIFQSTKELPDDVRIESLKIDGVYPYANNTQFAFRGRRLSPLRKSVHNVGIDGQVNEQFAKLLCDFWEDVDFNNSQSEGGVRFPASKKPEFLVARILTMFSSKNDLVLDAFLGSGTTCAVAHKMGRRYIGIEMGDHVVTHCVPRMQAVIAGEQSGISKDINWTGGGGFRFYTLGDII